MRESLPTANDLGELLTRMRRAQGLSARELGRRAGVTHVTLRAWERGSHLPRVPELQAVLGALGAPTDVQRRALALVDAPRTLHQLRQDMVADRWTPGPAPGGGDLLRALRLRSGRTQSDVAAEIGVSQGRLARWEQSEDWPSPERLHTLCFALGAHTDEVAALSAGVWLNTAVEAEDRLGGDPQAWGEYIQRTWQDRNPLRDLRLLSLEARLWRLAADDERARPLLMSAYACHARSLAAEGRLSEVPPYTACALDLARAGYGDGEHWAWAVIAASTAYRGDSRRHDSAARRRGREAAKLLAAWETEVRRPENRAWLQADLGKSLLQAGEGETALECSARACRMAEGADNPYEAANRQNDLAVLRTAMAHYGPALEALEGARPLADLLDETRVSHLLLEAECRLGLGQQAGAQDLVAEALTWCEQTELASLRPQATEIAGRF